MERGLVARRYTLFRLASFAGLAATLYCLKQIMDHQDEPHEVKLWFGILLVVILCTLPCNVFMFYYRAKQNDTKIDTIAVETLSALATRQKAESQATPTADVEPAKVPKHQE